MLNNSAIRTQDTQVAGGLSTVPNDIDDHVLSVAGSRRRCLGSAKMSRLRDTSVVDK